MAVPKTQLGRRAVTRSPSSRVVILSFLFMLAAVILSPAQSETGSIYGSVTDPTGAVVPGASVRLIDTDRDIHTDVVTDNSGFYSIAGVRPGHYRIEIEKSGFKLNQLSGITVNVQDNLEENFSLAIGSASEAITVAANPENLNTTDATVSTVVDNRFVENMPLNGRTFTSLIDLTPGVVLTPTNVYEQGQFSVNGQRPDANYFTVDGVSANVGTLGAGTSFGQAAGGQLPAISAFGGMSNVAPLDALQEFRMQTSSFAPEYGRTPGGQISVVTKSGTNDFHGTAFEYLRNNVLDANDWFANNAGLPRPELRQNDFGGVLGGPIVKDKLFFFGSYEGLRIRQPQVAKTAVPTSQTIQSAPAAVQPLLSAFPQPNGASFGNGTAAFTGSYSDPSTLNAGGIRIDYLLTKSISVFGRYNYAPSSIDQRAPEGFSYSDVEVINQNFQSLTLGSTQTLSPRWVNELRFNYSRNRADSIVNLDNYGGAIPPADSVLYQPSYSAENADFLFYAGSGLIYIAGSQGYKLQRQINLTDNISHGLGTHQLKFGVDYRRLNPKAAFVPYTGEYLFLSLSNVLTNTLPEVLVASRTDNVQLDFSSWSLFAQDTWKATRTLTITYGLRWEYNGAPSSPNGTLPFTVNQVENLATMTLAPQGTSLWTTQKDDFAPRFGLAWNPRQKLVVRAGGGIFYDLGYSTVGDAMSSFPFVQRKLVLGTSFPLSATDAAPPPFTTSPPVAYIVAVDPNHVLPRVYEWNAAVEQGLGKADVLTLSYVGAGGRKLMRKDVYEAPNSTFTGEVDILTNGATSNYNALQAEFRHRLAYGLQTLVSYTWSHSIDDASSDADFLNVPPGSGPASLNRGPSDYDIRQTFSGAVSYDIPGPSDGVLKQVFGNWSTDTIIYARSAMPVNVVTGQNPYPENNLSGPDSVQRPDVVSGVPFYIDQSSAPGGKIINAAAFTTPVPATAQGDLGRNTLRGFGATQWDLTARRKFRLTERFSLQFRGDFFNILNHPNFGAPINYLSSPQFGYATQMLNNYLGSGGQSGGLNPLYQIGGPRSIQLALKLQF